MLTFWSRQRPRQVLRKRSGRPSPTHWVTDDYPQPPKTPTHTRPSTSAGTPSTRPSPWSFGSARSRHSSYTYSPPTPYSERPSTASPKKEPKRWTSFYHSSPPPNFDALGIAEESEKESTSKPPRRPMTSRSFRSIRGAAKDQDRPKPKRRWSSGLRKLFLGERSASH